MITEYDIKITEDYIKALDIGLRLNRKDEDDHVQRRAIRAALRRFLVDGQRGVVLANAVGLGKTYEALAVISHLCSHARREGKRFERALVLCKPALVRKWEEETTSARPGLGFPRYLPKMHPALQLFGHESRRIVDNRAKAWELWDEGVRGRRVDGRNQVPPGLYIVNERLLQKEKREASALLSQIWHTHWDVVAVDEAHHYARSGTKPMLLFAPDGNLRNYDQPSLKFDKIIALTATPFELTPFELVNLLALVRADPEVLKIIEAGLQNYVRTLDRFFELRDRSPMDPLRRQQVVLLHRLRDDDALNSGGTGCGLQGLMRRFLIRNTQEHNRRCYFLVERGGDGFKDGKFRKLDEDLQLRVRNSPLIPFEGEHALFYLELRELIQAGEDRAHRGETSRTFIPTELCEGLSSYPQIAGSKSHIWDLEEAGRLRELVEDLNKNGKLHPKVAALKEIVRGIVEREIQKVKRQPDPWFSKVLIFNKLIRGTAPQLTEVLGEVLEAAFDRYLAELLVPTSMSREDIGKKVREAVDQSLNSAEEELEAEPALAAWRYVPDEFLRDEDFKRHHGRSLLDVFREPLRRRAVQQLALIDLIRNSSQLDDAVIATWVKQEVTKRVIRTVRRVIDQYLSHTHLDDQTREMKLDRAERALIAELEESKPILLVGRFDGSNTSDREAHRQNFNRRHNPFVLLVSQAGEEGMDFQEQCRYVIHYDLEWNPARMEQREGRVDRTGWGRESEGDIDVRFLILKGTYEERIFHTVMRRDQWFQILIGSKRKELGSLPHHGEQEEHQELAQEVPQDRIEDDGSIGALTEAEKDKVILNLQPED